MVRTFIPVAGVLAWAALGGLSAGQQTAPPQPSLTIRTTVNEVLLDFVVRDKHGRLVKNLKPDEFQIYEDGVRRDVLSFRLEAGPGGVRSQPASPAVSASGDKKDTAVPGPPPSTPGRSLRALNVVCIVFQNLDPSTRQFAVDAAAEFLNNDLEPGTWVGTFSLGDRLIPLHNFTTNRQEMLEAVKNAPTGMGLDFMAAAQSILTAEPIMAAVTLSGSGGPGGGGVTSDLVITGGELNKAAINGADVATSRGANMRRADMVADRRQFGHIEGMRETDQILLMIRELARLPGRKTVLLFSPGLATTGDVDRFDSILNKAKAAAISFFAIDVTGLTQNSNVVGSVAALNHVSALSRTQGLKGESPAVMMERMRQDDYLVNAVRTSDTQASLRALAEGTGGFLIGSTNDFKKPFQHVVEDIDTHYEAVYHPASEKYDGHLRKIEVKVTRPDVTVEARPGYFALPDLKDAPPLTPSDVLGLLALDRQPSPHAFDFRSAALQFRPEGPGSQYAVTLEIPVASMTGKPEPEQKRHRMHLALVGLVKDANGQVVDRFSQDTPYEFADDKWAALQAASIPYSHLVTLPPGKYKVETAVLDREGDRIATNQMAIDNPESGSLGLSTVMLVRELDPVNGPDAADPFRVGNNRVRPELTRTLSAGAKPFIYFVVYPDKTSTESPRVEVQFVHNGQVLARRTLDVPPAGADGAAPMLIGSVAKPGNCELKITAMQGDESLERSVAYIVAPQ